MPIKQLLFCQWRLSASHSGPREAWFKKWPSPQLWHRLCANNSFVLGDSHLVMRCSDDLKIVAPTATSEDPTPNMPGTSLQQASTTKERPPHPRTRVNMSYQHCERSSAPRSNHRPPSRAVSTLIPQSMPQGSYSLCALN